MTCRDDRVDSATTTTRQRTVMSVNKFGMSLERRGDAVEMSLASSSIESLRNYVLRNTLRLNEKEYDANERKIQRLNAPSDDTDASNKRYVDATIRSTREIIDRNIDALDKSVNDLSTSGRTTAETHEKRIKELERKTFERSESDSETIKSTVTKCEQDIRKLNEEMNQGAMLIANNRLIASAHETKLQELRKGLDAFERSTRETREKDISRINKRLNNVDSVAKKLTESTRELSEKLEASANNLSILKQSATKHSQLLNDIILIEKLIVSGLDTKHPRLADLRKLLETL